MTQKGKEERSEPQKTLMVEDRCGNTDGLNIEKADLNLDNGSPPMDSQMKTHSSALQAKAKTIKIGRKDSFAR